MVQDQMYVNDLFISTYNHVCVCAYLLICVYLFGYIYLHRIMFIESEFIPQIRTKIHLYMFRCVLNIFMGNLYKSCKSLCVHTCIYVCTHLNLFPSLSLSVL